MTQLDLNVSATEFFRSQVSEAAKGLKITLDEHLEFYLVQLLSDFLFTSRLQDSSHEIDQLSTPLTFMLQKALEAPEEKRLRILKSLGDTSLYFSGFFQDYFNRKTFGVDYYISMGKSAYNAVSSLVEDRFGEGDFSFMYRSLSDRFGQFVDILGTVSELNGIPQSNTGLLELYDRWNQTGSERIRQKLADSGIDPVQVSRKAQ